MGTYEKYITDIPDYPKEGVIFKDITTLLMDAEGFGSAVRDIASHFADRGITKIVGAEARGFMLGAPVAVQMGVGFVPARKPGKLPRATLSQEYDLEYGTDTLEIHADALGPDDVVLIVDDLIATGGTAEAMVKLIRTSGARLAGLAFLIELASFNPRALIAQETDSDFYSLVKVD